MRILIGIDDTDNKDSRGTGYNSRQLAAAIESNNLGKVHGITRHQYLFILIFLIHLKIAQLVWMLHVTSWQKLHFLLVSSC